MAKNTYTTKTLAPLLDVAPTWLNHNRKSSNPIPYHKLGHKVFYKRDEVLRWIGTSNLNLKFMSRKSLAKKFNFDIDCLKHNKNSKSPVPFYKLGHLVRYQYDEVVDWMEKNHVEQALENATGNTEG